MASSVTSLIAHPRPVSGRYAAALCLANSPAPSRLRFDRRSCLVLLPAVSLLAQVPAPAVAQDIPLFGLRKRLQKVEEEAEEIVREGEKAVEHGIGAAEEEFQAAEKGIAAVGAGGGFGAPAQAAAVAAAEVVSVLVAVSVVNGILGPEAAPKS